MKLYNDSVKILVGYRDGSEDGLTFAFRFTDASISIPNQGMLNLVVFHLPSFWTFLDLYRNFACIFLNSFMWYFTISC